MLFGLVAAGFLVATVEDPIDTALARTEPPASLRAAFTVELTDGEAFREVHYDPRFAENKWQVIRSTGKSDELDFAVAEWGRQNAPDGWLFADDLRASMGRIVDAEDVGQAWRVQFQHHPSENDGPMDVWAADYLAGIAWLEPVSNKFMRIDYTAMEPFPAPSGGTVETYNHSYFLQLDATLGISYISAYQMDVRGRFLSAQVERSYRVRVTDTEFFFASPADESLFRQKQMQRLLAGDPLFIAAN